MQDLIARHAMAFDDGRKVVATAGTAERLVSESTLCFWVVVQALRNTQYVSVGASTTAIVVGAERGIVLGPETSIPIEARSGGMIDLHDIWINAEIDGEGVNFFYGT